MKNKNTERDGVQIRRHFFQSETCNMKQGFAKKCQHDITCFSYGIVLLLHLLMGNALDNATYIDRLLVSYSNVYINCHLSIGNDHFWSCHVNLASNMSVKKTKTKHVTFEALRISRRDRAGFSKCSDPHVYALLCATVSASNFQVLLCSG